MIKNSVRDNAFIEYDTSQLLLIINDYLAYFIALVINLIRFKHFMIKRVINNINVELDIIEIQSIRCENNLMLLSQPFVLKINKFAFNHSNESIGFKIL